MECIFDLKTRTSKTGKELDMDDIYPLLWIRQIPNFIVAYHDGAGLFQDIRVQNVEKDVQTWQKDNKMSIGRFAILLNKIVELARDKKELLEVYYSDPSTLEIRRQYGQGVHVLPSCLADSWAKESDTGSGPFSD